jgi:transketolase
VLFFHEQGMHYDPANPSNFLNDRLVLSKGHAAPILCLKQNKLYILSLIFI